MSTTPALHYAARAFEFYELDRAERSGAVSKYLELFEIATGVDAIDCLMGGLNIVIREEARDFDEVANSWHATPRPHQCENPKEAKELAAYEAVRMKPLAEFRELIIRRESNRHVRDWNLIALSQAPLCDLGDMGVFALNHTALGRSLFDSVRHAILTAALEERLPDPWTNEQAIGELYGKIFQSYVFSVFDSAFHDRVWSIPAEEHQKRADFLIWFPDKVIIAEVKGVHFVGLQHASYLSIEERREELLKIGIPNAVNQLASTVRALRAGEIHAPAMSAYDWTITPIIPVIVTEERIPQVPGCWDAFCRPMCGPLANLDGAGPLRSLRLLNIVDVETIPDLEASDDLGALFIRWGADPRHMELPWGNFLATQHVRLRNRFIPDRYFDAARFLARRLDLDETQLTRHDQFPVDGEETDRLIRA